MNTNASFINDLLRRLPQLKPLYDEHLADNDMLLPHVFMGAVTRFVIVEVEKSASREFLEELMDYFEAGLEHGAEQIKELIVVSFLENLADDTVALERLKPLFGPRLRKEVENIFGH